MINVPDVYNTFFPPDGKLGREGPITIKNIVDSIQGQHTHGLYEKRDDDEQIRTLVQQIITTSPEDQLPQAQRLIEAMVHAPDFFSLSYRVRDTVRTARHTLTQKVHKHVIPTFFVRAKQVIGETVSEFCHAAFVKLKIRPSPEEAVEQQRQEVLDLKREVERVVLMFPAGIQQNCRSSNKVLVEKTFYTTNLDTAKADLRRIQQSLSPYLLQSINLDLAMVTLRVCLNSQNQPLPDWIQAVQQLEIDKNTIQTPDQIQGLLDRAALLKTQYFPTVQ